MRVSLGKTPWVFKERIKVYDLFHVSILFPTRL